MRKAQSWVVGSHVRGQQKSCPLLRGRVGTAATSTWRGHETLHLSEALRLSLDGGAGFTWWEAWGGFISRGVRAESQALSPCRQWQCVDIPTSWAYCTRPAVWLPHRPWKIANRVCVTNVSWAPHQDRSYIGIFLRIVRVFLWKSTATVLNKIMLHTRPIITIPERVRLRFHLCAHKWLCLPWEARPWLHSLTDYSPVDTWSAPQGTNLSAQPSLPDLWVPHTLSADGKWRPLWMGYLSLVVIICTEQCDSYLHSIYIAHPRYYNSSRDDFKFTGKCMALFYVKGLDICWALYLWRYWLKTVPSWDPWSPLCILYSLTHSISFSHNPNYIRLSLLCIL